MEIRISDIQDDRASRAAMQSGIGKSLTTLQAKVKDLEARSRRSNLCVVGIAETRFAKLERLGTCHVLEAIDANSVGTGLVDRG
ncbi:hypothetical protein NDU88_004552 [Pleurodeles waltl]|uniref:Uncharacterized protein n=1 Tax=Pleurodeles waltl TaxID=8319 RepID=A0AAV7M6M4_PLEWA|nr:hypothetical protein NDU88_004552 [Pleurodeles waltl]